MSDLPNFSAQGYQVVSQLDQSEPTGWFAYLARVIQPQPDPTKSDSKPGRSQRNFITTIRQLDRPPEQVLIRHCQITQAELTWEQVDHYRQGIQLLKELDHPHLLRYLDFFETEDGFCLVQQFVEARPLSEHQSFEPAELKKITIALLETLVYLQNRVPPIVHQYIRPETILMDAHHRLYLAGFNVATILPDLDTSPAIATDLPGFVPPEQVIQDPLTAASDLYSLGATLFCLLTGTPSQEIDRLLDEQLRFKLTCLPSSLNPVFVGWLQKLVEPNPSDRYPNAAAALQAIAHRSIQRTAPQLEILRQPKVLIPTLVAAGLVLGIGSLGGLWLWFSASKITPPIVQQTPTPVAPKTAADWLKEGDSFREKNDYDRALEAYQQAIELEPENQAAWFYRGFCLGQLRRYPEAITAYDQALELNPKDYTAWYNRGWVRKQLPDYPASLTDFERAIDLKPDYQLAWFQKGTVLSSLKRYPDALKAYDQALELDPKDTKSWNNRGLVLTELGKHEEALKAYDKALEIDDRNAIAWNNRGWALYKLGKNEAALIAYNRALAIQPDYELAINNRKLVLNATP